MYRSDFPIFSTHPDLVFLDSASSAQKPQYVIDRMSEFMSSSYANIHRGSYDLSMESSLLYDRAKNAVAKKLSVRADEIVFTYNATYAFNLIARSFVKSGYLKSWDTVLLSKVDHHANIVPWQILAEEYGVLIDWIDIHPDGTLDYSSLESKLPHAKVLSITGSSNVTGEVLDLERVHSMIKSLTLIGGAGGDTPSNLPYEGRKFQKPLFILDGSQRFPHMWTDVAKYGIDFFIATGHKFMSDTGIGFFSGRKDLLQKMEPAFCGGGAINSVALDGYEAAGLPFRHEPGTPHIIGAVSLLAALEYIDSIGGYEAIEKYEKNLTEYALQRFEEVWFLDPTLWGGRGGVRLLGSRNPENRLGVFSFVFEDHHPNDVAEMLADSGICVRSWHHCTDPLHHALGIWGSLRASLYIYNTREDVERFIGIISNI